MILKTSTVFSIVDHTNNYKGKNNIYNNNNKKKKHRFTEN